MTGHLKLMPLLATPSLLLGEPQVPGSTNSATIPTVPRGACSPLWGLLLNNRVVSLCPKPSSSQLPEKGAGGSRRRALRTEN